MSELTLTKDQQNAYEAFSQFILDETKGVFILEGYSGTGKSTLVQKLIADLPKLLKTLELITQQECDYEVCLTATTNKAAENLSFITGETVTTIHSKLGLTVHTDYKSGKTSIKLKPNAEYVRDTILFIDEASYIDYQLFKIILENTKNCKVIFIGDPAQLLSVGCKASPVFDESNGFMRAKLEEVVRQAEGNPIMELSTAFRHTVNTGEFFSFVPDGSNIVYLDRQSFDSAIASEFTRDDWSYHDSKVLAWTNKCVIDFNRNIHNLISGNPKFAIGDYAICNSFVFNNKGTIKTDQLVMITGIKPDNELDTDGYRFELDHSLSFFMPLFRDDHKAALKLAREEERLKDVAHITNSWIDLRAAYACTINKSQGSTFNKVFLDLDDIKKCRNGNQLARMLYVGVSRAREHVILTGDLV